MGIWGPSFWRKLTKSQILPNRFRVYLRYLEKNKGTWSCFEDHTRNFKRHLIIYSHITGNQHKRTESVKNLEEEFITEWIPIYILSNQDANYKSEVFIHNPVIPHWMEGLWIHECFNRSANVTFWVRIYSITPLSYLTVRHRFGVNRGATWKQLLRCYKMRSAP